MHENVPPDIKIEAISILIYLCLIAGIIPKTTPKAEPDIPPQ